MRVTKEAELILNNPYCILGLPCNAEKMDIIKAQEKINKLSKIGAEKSYKTEFYSDLLPEVDRSSGIIQSAMARIDKPESKLFWFVDKHYIQQFTSEDVKNEFLKAEYLDQIKYDCFLANYLLLLLSDIRIISKSHWEKVFKYIDFLLSSDVQKLMYLFVDRFSSNIDVLKFAISNHILSPVYELFKSLNIENKLELINLLSDYDSKEFIQLKDGILENLVSEIEKDCSFVLDFLNIIPDIQKPSEEEVIKAAEMANTLIELVNYTVDPILQSTSIHNTYIDRIKDTYYMVFKRLSNVLGYGRSFGSAYNCATHANRYVPAHKKTEAKESLEFMKVLKEAETKIADRRRLSYYDNRLLNSSDPRVFVLALRAIGADFEAQFILGSIYITMYYERTVDLEIPFNESEGVRWIKMSAEQGYPKAQMALGVYYMSTNVLEAATWLSKAANSGNLDAIKALRMLGIDYKYKPIVSKSSYSNHSSSDVSKSRGYDYSSPKSSDSDSGSDSMALFWILFVVFFIFIIVVFANSSY